MRRVSHVRPGFDCISGPCTHEVKCPGSAAPRAGSNHGRHGDEWCYAVVSDDGRVATSLTVFTDRFPACTPRSLAGNDTPRGADLSTCTDLPWELEHLLPERELGGRTCQYLGRPCATYRTGALVAQEFFEIHGRPQQHDQPEAFWTALEAWHAEVEANLREQHAEVERHVRCPSCEGRGVIKIGRTPSVVASEGGGRGR